MTEEQVIDKTDIFKMPERKEESLSEMQFIDKGIPSKQEKEKSKSSIPSSNTEFISKSSNRRLNEPYNIKFTISSDLFKNLVEFIGTVGYDVLFIFKKKEVLMLSIDAAQTHSITVKFEKIEFSDYIIKELENDDDEKVVYIDISVIIDELSINEKFPIDFYVDTLEMNRFYVVNGKEIVEKQLESLNTSDSIESTVSKYKSMYNSIKKLTSVIDYQKVVVNQVPFMNVIKSLSKKTEKGEGKTTYATLYSNKHELDFRIEKDVKKSSIMLSGEDIMVYPLREDKVVFSLAFLNKIGKLKLTFVASMYICTDKPIIIETRLGIGKCIVHFLIAPRIEDSD